MKRNILIGLTACLLGTTPTQAQTEPEPTAGGVVYVIPISEMIERDRNRAAVIFWSIGNETPINDERNTFMRALAEQNGGTYAAR